jgi:hypothetical protein
MPATTIKKPLSGEDLIGIEPELLQQVDPGWRRRLSLFTGRALSDTALDAEQLYRAGRLAMLGQSVTPGTVSGLEAALDLSGPAPSLVVHPGYGILDNGEDVTLLATLKTQLNSVALIDANGNSSANFAPSASTAGNAGILLLQPIVVQVNGASLDTAPTSRLVSGNLSASCDSDPSEYAFQDLDIVDGCRLAFLPWPSFGNSVTLPPGAPATATWRNRIANAIFAAEALLPPDESFPWSLLGLPLGILAFDVAGKPLFLDRSSIVRQGGLPRRRYALPAQPGLPQAIELVQPALAQARIAQFIEQVVQTPASAAAASFALVPPAGVVPASFVDFTKKTVAVLPKSWILTAGPIHLEELEAALQTGMTASPLDVTQPETVEILVPLPDSLYDARILVTETVDPAFQAAIDDATMARNITLQHRKVVQQAADVVLQSTGKPKVDLDAGLTTDEKTARDATPPVYTPTADDAYGTAVNNGVYTSVALNNLQTAANSAPYTTTITVGGVATPIKLFSADDINIAINKGVQAFIDRINAKLNRADDLINLSFVTAQTDIYRYRQNVLGASDASRLATSPVLANIAMGDSASATAQNIGTYFNSISSSTAPVAAPKVFMAETVTAAAVSAPIAARLFTPVRALAPPNNSGLVNRLGTTTFRPVSPIMGPVGPISRPVGPVGPGPVRTVTGTGTATAPAGASTGTSAPKPAPIAPAAPRVIFDTSQLRLTASIPKSDLSAEHVASTTDVSAQQPVVGAQLDLRTLTIAERLAQSKSQESLFYSLGNRLNITALLLDLEITIDDLEVIVDSAPPATPPTATAVTRTSIATERRFVSELRPGATNKSNAATLLATPHLDNDSDEAGLFSSGVRVLDQHTQLLRAIEGRIQLYRDFLASVAAPALSSLQASVAQVEAAMASLDNDLHAERQNLAFTLALLSDEQKRIAAVNLKRTTTLATSVQVVAFTRPRTLVTQANVPSRQLVPADFPSPVPACLGQSPSVPPELRDMIALLRETPVIWYPWAWGLVEKIERPALLNEVMAAVQSRATFALTQTAALSAASRATGTYAPAIAQIFTANQQMVRAIQVERAQLDATQYAALSWAAQVAYLRAAAALADLIATERIHAEIAIATARLVQQVSSVAACLYTRVGLALPADRLQWAEFLRGKGATENLNNLGILPGWNNQPYLERQQMQLLVDWLFQQIDRTNNSTVAFFSDVVRTCILLASHAPPSAVIPGTLKGTVTPIVGYPIILTSASDRVAHGMGVQIYSGAQLAAEGVVSDLDKDTVTATVTRVHIANASIADKSVVHFTSQSTSFAAYKAFA